MNTAHILSPTVISVVAATSFFNSCIFDSVSDNFYQTRWYSEEAPLGPFNVSTLTLEFLCNGEVILNTTGATGMSDQDLTTDLSNTYNLSGKYYPYDDTAVLERLSATFGDHTVTFIKANRSGDTLFLLWRIEDSVYPFTTALRRVTQ